MKKLIQKNIFTTTEFQILDNKLSFTERRFGNENEREILFENLGASKRSQKISKPLYLVGSFASALISFLAYFLSESTRNAIYGGIFWAAVALFTIGYYFATKKNIWKIDFYNNNTRMLLNIYKEIPNKTEVYNFIEELIIARNEYLKTNYTRIDKNLSYESQFSKLEWLKNIEAISITEFNALHEKLKSTSEPTKRRVGFE